MPLFLLKAIELPFRSYYNDLLMRSTGYHIFPLPWSDLGRIAEHPCVRLAKSSLASKSRSDARIPLARMTVIIYASCYEQNEGWPFAPFCNPITSPRNPFPNPFCVLGITVSRPCSSPLKFDEFVFHTCPRTCSSLFQSS